MMNVSIVKAESQHVNAISRICTNGWRQTIVGKFSEDYQKEIVNYWYSHKKIKSDTEEGTYTHVALVDNQVVGTIGGAVTGEGVGEVFVFYIDDAYRYQGIGKLLQEAITSQQKELGVSEQLVSVAEGNELGIPFYEARGFEFQTRKTKIVDHGKESVTLRYKRKI